MKRNLSWITLILAGALLLGGCGGNAANGGKSAGAGRSGSGSSSAADAVGGSGSGAGAAGAGSAAMNTPEGKAVQAEVLTELQGIEQDLGSIEAGTVIDAEAEAGGF